MVLTSWTEALKSNVDLNMKVVEFDSDKKTLRATFNPQSDVERNNVVAYCLCDSRRWQSFQRRRTRPISYWFGMRHVLNVGLGPIFAHLFFLLKSCFYELKCVLGY